MKAHTKQRFVLEYTKHEDQLFSLALRRESHLSGSGKESVKDIIKPTEDIEKESNDSSECTYLKK